MIKKIIVSLGIIAATFTSGAALSQSTTIPPSGFLLLTTTNTPLYLLQAIVQADTATNTAVKFVDAPTNSLVYVTPAYTNTVSYATNYITGWTNYYGVVQYATNLSLIDVTNNLVLANTNSYPVVFSANVTSNTTATFYSLNVGVTRSLYATNTSSGEAVVTISYVPVQQR